MSNDEYLRWQGLLHKVAKRYVGINSLYDIEDLIQIGAIGLAKGLESYNQTLDIPLKNWLYRNVAWTICRELDKNKSIDAPMSLYTPLRDDEDITLEEIIADNNIDVEAEIENKIMMDYYLKECERILPTDKFDVCYLKWFKGCSNTYIAETTNRKSINDVLRQSRSLLLTRSRVLNAEYRKMVGISDYKTERIAII